LFNTQLRGLDGQLTGLPLPAEIRGQSRNLTKGLVAEV